MSLQGCRIGHLDRPYGAWPRAVTGIPAAAMGLAGRGVGSLRAGGPADFVLFRGRRYSELLARPQFDRVRRRRQLVPPQLLRTPLSTGDRCAAREQQLARPAG